MRKATLRKTIVLVLLSVLFFCTYASAVLGGTADASGDTLLGRYWLPDHDGQFEIYKKESRYFGRVISYEVPDLLDEQNADPALRSRRFVGIDMFVDFEFEQDEKKWTGGTIYDAKSGKTYDCNLWFDAGEPNVLQGRGYIGFSFLGRTETFDRVIENP